MTIQHNISKAGFDVSTKRDELLKPVGTKPSLTERVSVAERELSRSLRALTESIAEGRSSISGATFRRSRR